MQIDLGDESLVFMVLYGPIETDARVLKSIYVLNEMNIPNVLFSCNSNTNFCSPSSKHINFIYHMKGPLCLLRFHYDVVKSLFKYRNNVKFFYIHDYLNVFLCPIIRLFSRKRILYDAHELMLYHKRDCITIREKFFYFLEKISIHKASIVVAANEEREKLMRRHYKLKTTTSVMNISIPREGNLSCSKKGKIIVYQGTLMESRNLSFFIKSHLLLDNDVKLKIIGGGPDIEYYKKLVSEYKLEDRVMITGRLSNEQMMKESAECMIGIISYPFTDLNNIYCSPNKIFEYASLRMPIISTSQPFLRECVTKYHIGECIEINAKPQEYASKVNEIFNNYSSYCLNFCDFLDAFSYDKETNKLKRAIGDIMINSRA